MSRKAGEQKSRGDNGDNGDNGELSHTECPTPNAQCPMSLLHLPPCSWIDVVTLVVGLVAIAFGLGGYGFYEPHEGHFGGVAREMLLRGDWITPTLNGAPYLNKPPLLYWLIATSTAFFGFSEFAARLPLAIAGWLAAVMAWKWARELWNPTAGRAAALMLCVTTGWFIFTHQILIDVLLSTLLLATYYCLWRFVWEPQSKRYFLALYLLVGLCLLSKGPFVLVFLITGCTALALSRKSWAIFQKLRVPLGVCVSLAVILPWIIAVEKANPGFLQYFVLNENLKRIADTRWPPDYDVSKVSVWGYLAVTAIWCAPWTLLLPQAVSSAWMNWKQKASQAEENLKSNLQNLASQRRREGILLVSLAAALPILLFLPLSSRLVYYSLPCVPPLAILCAGWWSRCQEKPQQWGRMAAGIIFSLLGLGVSSAVFWAPGLVKGLPELSNVPDVGWMVRAIALFIGLGWLLGGLLLLKNRPQLGLIVLFIAMACANGTITYGFAAVQDFRSSKTFIETANPRLGLTTLWTFEGSRELGAAGAMSYYLNRSGMQVSRWAGEQVGRWAGEQVSRGDKRNLPHTQCPMPNAQCPMPNAQCSMPNAQCPMPPGWAKGKPGTVYRVVMVLTDGGANRIPPAFPGSQPGYAITKKELQEFWNSSRPVLFVTDYLRQPNDPLDPPERNLPDNAGEALLVVGSRKLYGNSAAREVWRKGEN